MLFFPLCLQREYEEFKVRINGLVAKAQKVPEEGWVMQDGTPWPGNNTRDHPGMIQVKTSCVRDQNHFLFRAKLLHCLRLVISIKHWFLVLLPLGNQSR